MGRRFHTPVCKHSTKLIWRFFGYWSRILVGPIERLPTRLNSRPQLCPTAFLDFVYLRPDHRFDAAQVKGEIEKAAS